MANQTYQIQIALKWIKPKIWRRILIPSDLLLSDFHEIIQTTMGWSDSHLHQFIKNKTFYTVRMRDDDLWEEMNNVDYSSMRVSDLLKREKEKIIYEYDFGDSWEHEIILEKILPEDGNVKYAQCIGGEMNGPPEDCGGAGGYSEMVEILKQPHHEEYEGYMEWLGGEFDPCHFDKNEINSFLQEDEEDKQFHENQGCDLTYSDILLATKTKEQIIELGRSYGIKMKTSHNKADCAQLVEYALINKPQILKNVLSYNELSALKIILNEEESDIGFTFDDIDGLFAAGLLNISLTLKDKDPVTIPQNIKSAILPVLDSILDDPALQRNYKLENLIIGVITLYGALSLDQMVKLVNKYQDETTEKRELIKLLNNSPRLQRRIIADEIAGTQYLFYMFIANTNSIIHETSKREKTDYFIFSRKEIENASKALYYFNNLQIDKIKNFLIKNRVRDIDSFLHQLWLNIQNDVSPSGTIKFIKDNLIFDSFDDIQNILKLVTDYSNNIPKWILKGNSSHNIFDNPYEMPILSRKTGRNDPCPCGSGKKYKHCCGNN